MICTAPRRTSTTRATAPSTSPLGKFGPNLGVDSVESVIRLNNICNDLGLDTASTGSALGVGVRAVPARHHHHRAHRRPRAAVGRRRDDRAAAVHDVGARRLRKRARRFDARGGEGALPARGDAVPDRRERPWSKRSARRAHPQGVCPRPGGGDARHGSPAQPRHARDQRAHQRQPGLQGGAVRRPGQCRAEQLRAEGARGPRLRRHLRGRRFGGHVPLHDEVVQQPVPARPRGVPQPAGKRHRAAVHRRRARAVWSQRDGRRAPDQPSPRRRAARTTRCRIAGSTSRIPPALTRARRSIARNSMRCCRASTRSRG